MKWIEHMLMASEHFVWTPRGWLNTAATVNGRGCVVTPHIVGSGGLILEHSMCENPTLSDTSGKKPAPGEALVGSEHFIWTPGR